MSTRDVEQVVALTSRARRAVEAADTTPRRHPLATYAWCVLALDVAVMTLVGALAVVGRTHLGVFSPGVNVAERLDAVGPLSILGWLAATALVGGYDKDVFGSGTEELQRVLLACLVTAGLVGVGCYLAK